MTTSDTLCTLSLILSNDGQGRGVASLQLSVRLAVASGGSDSTVNTYDRSCILCQPAAAGHAGLEAGTYLAAACSLTLQPDFSLPR